MDKIEKIKMRFKRHTSNPPEYADDIKWMISVVEATNDLVIEWENPAPDFVMRNIYKNKILELFRENAGA